MKLKKILILCILIFSIIFISEASAEEKGVLEVDGTDWRSYPYSCRLAYIHGFITGGWVVENELNYYISENKLYYYMHRLGKRTLKLSTENYNKILNRTNLAGITIAQISDGMNVFYNDFSNRKIKIVDAIYIVKMQIKGENPELIDSQIRYLKMQPIDKEIRTKCSKKYWAFREKRERDPTYKEIKNGYFSFEDLLRLAVFIDASDNPHDLFCYGIYK